MEQQLNGILLSKTCDEPFGNIGLFYFWNDNKYVTNDFTELVFLNCEVICEVISLDFVLLKSIFAARTVNQIINKFI